jgi:tryptophan-rich sensory protein
MKATKRWIGLVVFIAGCLGAGSLGAIATTPEIDGWYSTLAKPTWNPPRQGVWTGVDHVLRLDGARRLAGLEASGVPGRRDALDAVR